MGNEANRNFTWVIKNFSSFTSYGSNTHVGELDVAVVESVISLFKKHPNIAANVRAKNPDLRATYFNALLGLTKILCKSSEELSDSDLTEAYSALRFVTKAGFKLDWLEKALKEACEIRIQEIEEKLNDLTEKRADMDSLLKSLNDDF